MIKLVILTASIIRGKFYEKFYNYLANYEIIHIINIDEPIHLKVFQ